MTMTIEARLIKSIKVERRVRGTVGDLHELVDSMRERGLLNPITIGPDGTLLAGERRLRAAQELGWTEIDAHVWSPKDDEPITELIALEIEGDENLLRLDFTPGEKKRLFDRLVPLREAQLELISGRCGRRSTSGPRQQAQAEVAKALGTSRTTMQEVETVRKAAEDESEPEEVREEARVQYEGLIAGTAAPKPARQAVDAVRRRGENLRQLQKQRRAEAEALIGQIPGQYLPRKVEVPVRTDWSSRIWNAIRAGTGLRLIADEVEVAEDRHVLDASNVKDMIDNLQGQINERDHLKKVLQTIRKENSK